MVEFDYSKEENSDKGLKDYYQLYPFLSGKARQLFKIPLTLAGRVKKAQHLYQAS